MPDFNEGITVTIKAHGGHDAPWFVVHAKDAASACDMVAAIEASGLPAIVGNAVHAIRAVDSLAQAFPGMRPINHPDNGGAMGSPQAAAPAPAAANPPGMSAPTCPHGTKVYKAAAPESGKTWKAWMCPARKGDASQCPPEWIK